MGVESVGPLSADSLGRGPCTRQPLVRGEQHQICGVGKFHVEGIGETQNVVARPGSGKQRWDFVSGHRRPPKLIQRRFDLRSGEYTSAMHAAQRREHLGVKVRWRVHDGVGQSRTHRRGPVRGAGE